MWILHKATHSPFDAFRLNWVGRLHAHHTQLHFFTHDNACVHHGQRDHAPLLLTFLGLLETSQRLRRIFVDTRCRSVVLYPSVRNVVISYKGTV